MAIRDLQARSTMVGRIRTGVRPAGGGMPQKLDTFRFSSAADHLIKAVAEAYGGQIEPFQSPTGPQFQVITETDRIPIFLPKQVIDPFYEEWGNGFVKARCDGETNNIPQPHPCECLRYVELGRPRRCKPTSRINVKLQAIPGLGVWRLDSHGINAAQEWMDYAAMLEMVPPGIELPGIMLLEKRASGQLQTDGKVEKHDYRVPIIHFDQITMGALMSGRQAIAEALGRTALAGAPERAQISAGPARDWLAEIATAPDMATLSGLANDIKAAEAGSPEISDAWKARRDQLREAAQRQAEQQLRQTPPEQTDEEGPQYEQEPPDEPGGWPQTAQPPAPEPPVDEHGIQDAVIVSDETSPPADPVSPETKQHVFQQLLALAPSTSRCNRTIKAKYGKTAAQVTASQLADLLEAARRPGFEWTP